MESNSYINKYRYFHNINYSFCHKNMLTLTQGKKMAKNENLFSLLYCGCIELLDINFIFFLIFNNIHPYNYFFYFHLNENRVCKFYS